MDPGYLYKHPQIPVRILNYFTFRMKNNNSMTNHNMFVNETPIYVNPGNSLLMNVIKQL